MRFAGFVWSEEGYKKMYATYYYKIQTAKKRPRRRSRLLSIRTAQANSRCFRALTPSTSVNVERHNARFFKVSPTCRSKLTYFLHNTVHTRP